MQDTSKCCKTQTFWDSLKTFICINHLYYETRWNKTKIAFLLTQMWHIKNKKPKCLAKQISIYEMILKLNNKNMRSQQFWWAIHANQVLVAPTVNVARSTNRLFVHACPHISDLLLAVVQNAWPVLSVQWTRHASIKDALIHAPEHAETTQDVTLTIIVPFARVIPDTREIRLHDAIPTHVSTHIM